MMMLFAINVVDSNSIPDLTECIRVDRAWFNFFYKSLPPPVVLACMNELNELKFENKPICSVKNN